MLFMISQSTLITVDIGNICVGSFATMAQSVMAEYVSEKFGDKLTHWAEEYWTGERWSICICQVRYLGCNNNIGLEVGFSDIKEVTPESTGISTFIGGMVHYMKEKGKDNEWNLNHLIDNRTIDEFIKNQWQPRQGLGAVQASENATSFFLVG